MMVSAEELLLLGDERNYQEGHMEWPLGALQ